MIDGPVIESKRVSATISFNWDIEETGIKTVPELVELIDSVLRSEDFKLPLYIDPDKKTYSATIMPLTELDRAEERDPEAEKKHLEDILDDEKREEMRAAAKDNFDSPKPKPRTTSLIDRLQGK